MRTVWIGSVMVLAVGLGLWATFAPFETVPGIFIGGEETPPPASWADVNTYDNALLETNSGIPHVVTVWYYASDAGLFVYAIASSTWLSRIRSNPKVRIRIGDATYSVVASEISDPDKIKAVETPYNVKYERSAENNENIDDYEYALLELRARS